MILVVVLVSLLDGSSLKEVQIPLDDSVNTPQTCAIAAQVEASRLKLRFPDYQVRRSMCVEASRLHKNI
jgi:hypothetical protein